MDEKEKIEKIKKETEELRNKIIISAAKKAGEIIDCQILALQKELNEAKIKASDAIIESRNWQISFTCSLIINIILLFYLFFI